MMMLFCPTCWEQVDSNASMCRKCKSAPIDNELLQLKDILPRIRKGLKYAAECSGDTVAARHVTSITMEHILEGE